MAILINRTLSIRYKLTKLIKLVLITYKHYSLVVFVVLSICLFHVSEIISHVLLETKGRVVTNSLTLYSYAAVPLQWIHKKILYLKNLEIENITLKLKVAELQMQQDQMRVIYNENLSLKSLLSVVKDLKYNYTTAKLLGISLSPFNKTALIGAGGNGGIKLDQVVTDGKHLIGRVIEVSNNYSTVLLVSDNNSRIPVITELSRERGILAGYNNKTIMVYLQKEHNITMGEKIITSGDGAVYPPGIDVAIVAAIKQGNVIAEPLMDIHNTNFVVVCSQPTE